MWRWLPVRNSGGRARLTLTHGTMPALMKQTILTAVTNDTNGNLSRVETGAWLILSSSYYNVWH